MKTAESRRHPTRKDINSCTVKHMNIKVGDDVLLKAPDGEGPYVAKAVKITSDRAGKNVRIEGAWYYRPEDTKLGRRNFHGAKELFRSEHVDIQLPESIEGKCKVHTFKKYVDLKEVEETDYFYRMEYDPNTEAFNVKRLEVFCVCNLPWNPDLVMVKCDECAGWYHPECLGLSREEAGSMEVFICTVCQHLKDIIRKQIHELAEVSPLKRPTTDKDSQPQSDIPNDAGVKVSLDKSSQTPSRDEVNASVQFFLNTSSREDAGTTSEQVFPDTEVDIVRNMKNSCEKAASSLKE